jgi:hypothetical protein
VRLVPSMILSTESPVNVWEDWLVLEVYCAEDTAAYVNSSSVEVKK